MGRENFLSPWSIPFEVIITMKRKLFFQISGQNVYFFLAVQWKENFTSPPTHILLDTDKTLTQQLISKFSNFWVRKTFFPINKLIITKNNLTESK